MKKFPLVVVIQKIYLSQPRKQVPIVSWFDDAKDAESVWLCGGGSYRYRSFWDDPFVVFFLGALGVFLVAYLSFWSISLSSVVEWVDVVDVSTVAQSAVATNAAAVSGLVATTVVTPLEGSQSSKDLESRATTQAVNHAPFPAPAATGANPTPGNLPSPSTSGVRLSRAQLRAQAAAEKAARLAKGKS